MRSASSVLCVNLHLTSSQGVKEFWKRAGVTKGSQQHQVLKVSYTPFRNKVSNRFLHIRKILLRKYKNTSHDKEYITERIHVINTSLYQSQDSP